MIQYYFLLADDLIAHCKKFDLQVYSRLQDIDADQAEPRAAAILAGLSFTEEMQV